MEKKILLSKINLSLCVIFMVLQPSFVRIFFKCLICTNIEGKSYLFYHVAQECWTDLHIKYVSIIILPNLFFILILIPFLILGKLKIYKSKKYVNDGILEYFVGGYKREYFLWDFVNMLQKLFLILLITFLNESQTLLLILNMVLFFFLLLQGGLRPYRSFEANMIATEARITLFFISHYISFYSKFPEGASRIIISIILAAVTLKFIVSFFFIYLRTSEGLKRLLKRLFINLYKQFRKAPDVSAQKGIKSRIKLNFIANTASNGNF